jgi:hypothetical protein
MGGTIIATTRSGSAYVLILELDGVRWVRIPARDRFHLASSGWLPSVPRIVPGERLFLGVLRSTPVDEVAFLPAPVANSAVDAMPVGAFC